MAAETGDDIYVKKAYRIITRDWKGSYDIGINPKEGWILLGGEEQIDTYQDSYALALCNHKNSELSAQEIWDIYNQLEYGDGEDELEYQIELTRDAEEVKIINVNDFELDEKRSGVFYEKEDV